MHRKAVPAQRAHDGAFNAEGERIVNRNVGTLDRVLRAGAGLALMGLALSGSIGAWGYVGIVPLVTGLIGSCPAYGLLGIRTCPSGDRGTRGEAP
jgi:hypothetical protein